MGQLIEAKEHIEQALGILPLHENPALSAQCLVHLGKAQSELGKMAEAETNLHKSMELFEEINDEVGLAQTLHSLGVILGKLGKYAEAEANYHRSIDIYKKYQQRLPMSSPLTQLAHLALFRNEPDVALEYLEEALVIRREFNYQQAIADTLKNIGYIYYTQGEFEKTEPYYDEARVLNEKTGNVLKLASLYSYIGDLRFEQERYDEALVCYQHNLQTCQEYQQPFGEINTLGGMATVYHKMDRIDLAMQTFIQSLETGLKYEATPYMLDVLTWLADVLADIKAYDLARYIAQFLMNYELSLGYVQSAAEEILEGLPPVESAIENLPRDHVALTHEILESVADIGRKYA